jgi:hypothetical protein
MPQSNRDLMTAQTRRRNRRHSYRPHSTQDIHTLRASSFKRIFELLPREVALAGTAIRLWVPRIEEIRQKRRVQGCAQASGQ